jgi:mono/diheme cytochrome c family protein
MGRKRLITIFLLVFFWGGGFLPFSWAAEKAASVYKDLCASCHGAKGRGDGPAATALNPKPEDFCKSKKHPTDADRYKMIAEGGAGMGHSPGMIGFGGAMDKQTITDLVAYMRSFCKK